MDSRTVILLSVLGAVFLLIGVGRSAYRRARESVKFLKGAMENIQEELAESPKSLNAMTAVYLPAIERDFPSFNLYQFITMAEDMLKSALRAIDQKDPGLLVNASESLKNQVRDHILALGDGEERYRDVKIHRTVVANYIKRGGSCVILLQSAVEYRNGEGRVQARYNIDLVYVQDRAKLPGGEKDKALGLSCPNCGAPIRGTGQARCEYCGAGVEAINIYAWQLNRFRAL